MMIVIVVGELNNGEERFYFINEKLDDKTKQRTDNDGGIFKCDTYL